MLILWHAYFNSELPTSNNKDAILGTTTTPLAKCVDGSQDQLNGNIAQYRITSSITRELPKCTFVKCNLTFGTIYATNLSNPKEIIQQEAIKAAFTNQNR